MQHLAPSHRWHLLPFWLAIFGRSAGANAVRTFALLVMFEISAKTEEDVVTLIFSWLLLSAVPMVLLSPLIAAVAGSGFRRGIMILGGLVSAGASLLCLFQGGPWLGCVGILAIEGAFFSASKQAMIPSISRQTWLSLPQLQAVFAVASLGGALTGVLLSVNFDFQLKAPANHMPLPFQVGLIGYAVMVLGLLFSKFAVETEWTPRDGIVFPFLRGVGAVVRRKYTRISLLLLLAWLVMFLVLWGKHHWFLATRDSYRFDESFALALIVGVVIGGLLHFHPFRSCSIAPPALTALFFFLLYSVLNEKPGDPEDPSWTGPVWVEGILLGCVVMPLMTLFQSQLPPKTQGSGLAYLFLCCAVVVSVLAVIMNRSKHDTEVLNSTLNTILLVCCGAGAVYAWFALFVPLVETIGDVVLPLMHRISYRGPGVWDMPTNGPVLVIANHAAMLDPIWLSVVIPQSTRPLMISKVYDKPFISWLMRKLRAIRVEDSLFRREAPELQIAIQALKDGDGVMIFPEGWLRRKEEVPMKRFSRGVWQILKACPDVPVYAFWVEGGWGSYFSFKDGEPMKNKKLDIRRKIRIAGLEGRKVDPKILEKHLQTRALLMEWVLEARALLDLPPIDMKQLPQTDDEEAKQEVQK
jgi:1-acyl-sn-glycerol-3-phosphate acyltransferase